VNVWVEVPVRAELIVAGDQVPVNDGMFIDFAGRTGGGEFWQTGAMGRNVGVITGTTLIVMEVVEAHCPLAGVNT